MSEIILSRRRLVGAAVVLGGGLLTSCVGRVEEETPPPTEYIDLGTIKSGFIEAPGFPNAKGFNISLNTAAARDDAQKAKTTSVRWGLGDDQEIVLRNGIFSASETVSQAQLPDGSVVYIMASDTPDVRSKRYSVTTPTKQYTGIFSPPFISYPDHPTTPTKIVVEGSFRHEIPQVYEVVDGLGEIAQGTVYVREKNDRLVYLEPLRIDPKEDTLFNITEDVFIEPSESFREMRIKYEAFKHFGNKLLAKTQMRGGTGTPAAQLQDRFEALREYLTDSPLQTGQYRAETVYGFIFKTSDFASAHARLGVDDGEIACANVLASCLFSASYRDFFLELSSRLHSLAAFNLGAAEANPERDVVAHLYRTAFDTLGEYPEETRSRLFPYMSDIVDLLNLSSPKYDRLPTLRLRESASHSTQRQASIPQTPIWLSSID